MITHCKMENIMNYGDMVNQLARLFEKFVVSKTNARAQMLPEVLRQIDALKITIRRRPAYACPLERCVSLTGEVKAMALLRKPPDYDDAWHTHFAHQDIYLLENEFGD